MFTDWTGRVEISSQEKIIIVSKQDRYSATIMLIGILNLLKKTHAFWLVTYLLKLNTKIFLGRSSNTD